MIFSYLLLASAAPGVAEHLSTKLLRRLELLESECNATDCLDGKGECLRRPFHTLASRSRTFNNEGIFGQSGNDDPKGYCHKSLIFNQGTYRIGIPLI